MNALRKLGCKQALLPPHERPHIKTLRRLGFAGSDAKILQEAQKKEPWFLLACSSASSMWAANSATFTPSCDSHDGRAHMTPANLTSNFHRSVEAKITEKILKRIFENENLFAVHSPLPEGRYLADEGSANHTRLCRQFGESGLHVFVFSRSAFQSRLEGSHTFPARQTLEASHSIARLHQIDQTHELFIQQNPEAIDLGVFHNDVISTGNQNLFLFHERAFVDTEKVIKCLQEKYAKACRDELNLVEVKAKDVTIKEAIETYLFNSQIVTQNDGSMIMIAPLECRHNSKIHNYLETLVSNKIPSISDIHYLDLFESMQNGGGPACLRCRFVLNEKEIASIKPNIFLNDELYHQLKSWIERHYRDRLTLQDLADPKLLNEGREALDVKFKI